jgi:hypothetical protein
MDIIHTLKSLYTISKYSYNFLQIYEEPINLIENIYVGNLYHITNWVILRDYNFKFVFNLSKKNLNFNNVKFNNFDSDLDLNLYDKQQINLKLEPIINEIIQTQSIVDSKTGILSNIIITAEYKNDLILILIIFLKTKYNLSLNRILRLLKLKNIIKNDYVNQKMIEITK